MWRRFNIGVTVLGKLKLKYLVQEKLGEDFIFSVCTTIDPE
jgi:hypothetical protein